MRDMRGNGNPIDLSGLPPDLLYALIELIAGQKREPRPYESIPLQPGELDSISNIYPRGSGVSVPINPLMFHNLLNRQYPSWSNVEPGM